MFLLFLSPLTVIAVTLGVVMSVYLLGSGCWSNTVAIDVAVMVMLEVFGRWGRTTRRAWG